MKCVICNEKITADPNGWEGGCNAMPVAEKNAGSLNYILAYEHGICEYPN